MHNFFVIVIILMFADEKIPQNKCIIFFNSNNNFNVFRREASSE